MKIIPLTQGKITLVDDEDYERLKPYPWFAIRQRHHWYAVYATGPSDARVHHRMHTIIITPPPGLEVDHRDGDGLNNRRYNLRVASSKQNGRNRRKIKTGTSKFKGVNWKADAGKWVARIMVDKKHTFLGYFVLEEDAARAYDAAAVRLHGEFGRLNFPKGTP